MLRNKATKRPPAKKTAKPIRKPLPDWLETPEVTEVRYALELWDGGCSEHSVEMTQDEFEMMKRHLARTRGFNVPESEADAPFCGMAMQDR